MRGFHLHQAASPEHAQVAAHGGTAHLAFTGEFARGEPIAAQQADYPAASRVGQRGERRFNMINHIVNYYYKGYVLSRSNFGGEGHSLR